MKLREVTARTDEAAASAAAPAAQAAGKGVGRFIPGVGLALGAYDAYNRAKQGDYTGAALSGAAGIAGMIPGIGTAASLGLAGAQAARDKARTGSWLPDEEEIGAAVAKDKVAQPTQAAATPTAKLPPGADPKVFALQQQLIAKGAKITPDGKMGPQTQAAMKQFPDVKLAESIKENKMTEAERIAALRERLSQLESQPQVADEGIGDVFKGIGKGIQKFKTGISNPRSTNLPSGKNLPQQTGAAIARNPGKVAAGAAAAGALGTASMMGGAGTNPATGASATPAKPAAPAKPATPAKPAAPAAGLTPKEEEELALLAADMVKLKGQNSELDALIDRHMKLRPDAGQIANPQ